MTSDILSFKPDTRTVFDAFNNFNNGMTQQSLHAAQADEARGRADYYRDRGQMDLARGRMDLAKAQKEGQPFDAMALIAQYKQILSDYPSNSPEYQMANQALGGLIDASYGNPTFGQVQGFGSHGGKGGGGGLGGGMGGGMAVGEDGQLLVNVSTDKQGVRGTQSAKQNADNSWTYYTSPTTAVETANLKRINAHEEVQGLGKVFINGQLPYVGLGGRVQYLKDLKDAYVNKASPEQLERLKNYDQSERIKPELAKNIDKFASGGTTSVEGTKAIERNALNSKWYLPQSIVQKSLNDYLPIQTQAFNQSLEPTVQNYPINSPNKAAWIDPGFGSPVADRTWTDKLSSLEKPAPKPRINAPQKNTSNLDAQAADAIKRGADPKAVYARLAQLKAGR